jgi:PKD repeat protein
MSRRVLVPILVAMLLASPFPAFAQEGPTVQVTVTSSCSMATFQVTVEGVPAPYSLVLEFGDGDVLDASDIAASPHEVEHAYPAPGEYVWSVTVNDSAGASASASDTLDLGGPQVVLTSDPFPPLVELAEGGASVSFTAEVAGGSPPYLYTWDLNGDGSPQVSGAESQAAYVFDEAGRYEASVAVEDSCGWVVSDSLTIVVMDTETSCHPMAERIAQAVSALFPDRAEQVYTCEDIYALFQTDADGQTLGFGRMWHAYQLTQALDELAWEDILDWHLDRGGWGMLVQLDRFADVLEETSLSDLVSRVLSGETSVQDVRTAVRAVVRQDADFEDALARLAAGVSSGELTQFYRTVNDLEIDPATLDATLDRGLSLPEIQHAAKVADRLGTDWSEIVGARADGQTWGEISRAARSEARGEASEETPRAERQELRDQERLQEREDQQAEHSRRMVERMAQRLGISEAEVLALYEGPCAGDWACVVERLREQSRNSNERGQGRNQ